MNNNKDITLLQGHKNGKTIVILGGIHGNEPSGISVINKLINEIKTIDSGNLYLILGNPQAIEKNIRFIESNMNRCFADNLVPHNEEEERAIIIKEIIKKADILIDIHNTIREKTYPFLITEYTNSKLIDYFELQYIVEGLINLHPGSTDGYGYEHGVESICLEVGSISDPLSTETIYNSIISILSDQDMITGNGDHTIYYKNKKVLRANKIIKAQSINWNFANNRGDFDFIEQGTLIGTEDGNNIYAPYNLYILFPKLPHYINDEVCIYAIE